MPAPEHCDVKRAARPTSPIRFYFGIPLRARASALNWDQVCRNLDATLDSLAQQTRRDFRVLVSCHDIPDIDTRGLDIRFMKAGFAPPLDDQGRPKNDKHKKKHRLGLEVGKEVEEDVYFMPLDADDLVHPELVETVLKDDNRVGYLMERGLIFNAATGHCRECDPETHPFWRYCGSCAVLYFKADELPQWKGDKSRYYSCFLNHKRYAQTAREAGRALVPLDTPMAVYIINHGENDWTVYRQGSDGKTDHVEKSPIRDSRRLNALRALYPQLSFSAPGVGAHPLVRRARRGLRGLKHRWQK